MRAFLRRKPLLVVLLGALLLRSGTAVGLQSYLDRLPNRHFLIEGDASGYWELGRRLATGRDYTLYQPPRRVMRMPGFPLFMAGSIRVAQAVGLRQQSFLVARLLLAGVGTVACALVYLLGKELFDEATGLWAAGLAAVMPVFVGFSVLILSETLFAACLLFSLLLMAKLVNKQGQRHKGTKAQREIDSSSVPLPLSPFVPLLAVCVGSAVALACHVRPSWLAAGPVFAVMYAIWSPQSAQPQAALREEPETALIGRAWVPGALVVVGMGLAMVPWTIRNYRVTGHWVVTTLWVGPSLYDGLNPQATGESNMTFFDRDSVMTRQGLSEYEMDRYYRHKAWEFVRNHPVRVLQLAVVKLARFWKPWPNAEQFSGLWQRAGVAVCFVPLMLLALRGWWMSRKDVWRWALTVGPILYFSAVHMVFVGSLRYRLPAEYPLCVLSAAGLHSWFSQLGRRGKAK